MSEENILIVFLCDFSRAAAAKRREEKQGGKKSKSEGEGEIKKQELWNCSTPGNSRRRVLPCGQSCSCTGGSDPSVESMERFP